MGLDAMYRARSRCQWAMRAKLRETPRARGQALVEFALVVPIFLLLIFAVIEFSLINASIGSYNFAAKDAARYGALKGSTDTAGCSQTVTIGCGSDLNMLNIIQSQTAGVVAAQIVSVEIFDAGEAGGCANGTTTFPCPTEDMWTAATNTWSCPSSGLCWGPASHNDKLLAQDYIGVHIVYLYTYVTAFFSSTGANITLTADSVQRIEPQQMGHRTPAGTIAAVAPTGGPSGEPLAAWLLVGLAPLTFTDQSARRAIRRLEAVTGSRAREGV